MKNLKKELNKIIRRDSTEIVSDLKKAVAESIQAEGEDRQGIKAFLSDLFQHGCQSGMVNEMIYYKDTHAFFDKHSDDIFDMLDELEEEMGEPIKVDGDRKNFYAWLAYEETARAIARELGLEDIV